MDDERRVAYALKMISEKCGIPLVATNDVHYLEKSDADIQATLMCVQTNNVITEGRPFGFETDEYYFKTAEYQKTVSDINAKTSIIQQEDRTLELRLKQLDTEQNALATEMDAVKKVIKDNVEKTFKTFSD